MLTWKGRSKFRVVLFIQVFQIYGNVFFILINFLLIQVWKGDSVSKCFTTVKEGSWL